ncbi:hypothetical protein D779_3030 [Imhoffiella purpurea]|uniref:HAMP domain-containing protein n=1 Tax=Imhoffiella purpurea TaxID=1249627 RepID=W9V3H4_9GAMM|nr:hypothetical protein D779_3030 [Imhoffiella purpurea]
MRRVAFRYGLTFQQAAMTLLVVLVLGIMVGAGRIFVDWRAMHVETRSNIGKVLALVEGSAAEAAYQLHPELARRLVDGLLVFDPVVHVELRTDFGRILALRAREPDAGSIAPGWGWLFEDASHYRLRLEYGVPGGEREDVGQLRLDLSPEMLARRFLHRVARDAVFELVRSLFISALVVAIFYFMITRPLLRLGRAIAEVDPDAPGDWLPPRLKGHGRDELGLLSEHLRRLLQSSQRGLDQRDLAQRELTLLNQELERRVEARTLELERALGDLERQKTEVERAFSELDLTHRHLALANQQLLESHRYARRIQTSMLPDSAVLGDAVHEIQVHWEPLHQVGGDWYWFARRGERCLLLLADCTGHGVPGAFITLVVAAALEHLLHHRGLAAPGLILQALDLEVRRRLRQQNPGAESDDGLDAAALCWEAGERQLRFASVGSIPLLAMVPGEPIEVIRGARGHLGYRSLAAPNVIAERSIQVGPGTTLYLMTDGVPDQMGGTPRRLLGRRKVAAWLEAHCELGLADQVAGLSRMLADYRRDEARRDDMTLIALRPI